MRLNFGIRPRGALGVASALVLCLQSSLVPPLGAEAAVPAIPQVRHFERLPYPLYARIRAIQGLVVVRAMVTPSGSIERAEVLSGPKSLQGDTISSLKKWTFASGAPGEIVVVFWFRLSGLCEAPCQSGFEFYPPNLAIITSGTTTVMP